MKRAASVLVLVLLQSLVGSSAARASDPPAPLRVGDETLSWRETPHPAPRVAAGAEAWRDIFVWPEASYIAVHFTGFSLAPGEKVVVATPDGSRAYTLVGEGKPLTRGTFWAPHVPGNTCVVTYYGNGGQPGYGYVVDRFAHGYSRSPGALAAATESVATICGGDDTREARCYAGSEPLAYDKSRAVARLLIGGITFCTGWLVGCEGHLLTNAHCITSESDALDTDFEFMAEGPSCGTHCFAPFACPGIVEANTSLLVKRDLPRDYALVLPPANLSSGYGFLKMRPGGASVNERIYIPGHPSGWGKRLALESTSVEDESGFCEIFSLDSSEGPCQSGGPPDVDYFCDTQGGSSGSPVIAHGDNRVVALHHCAPCPNRAVPIQEIIDDLGDDLPRCATQQLEGTVGFEEDRYACSRTGTIRVVDDSLDGDGTLEVGISSPKESVPETVVLTETPGDPGVFRGEFTLTGDPPTIGDGLLSVSDAETVTVTYVDADDGLGGTNVVREGTALVDCVVPLITDVVVTSVTGSGATITWSTSEPATSLVHYGTTSPGEATASSSALVSSHSLSLTGLAQCAGHLFDVASRDEAGNEAVDDNGGGSYSFTTVANTEPTFTSSDTPMAIADDDPAGATSVIAVDDDNVVVDVDVKANVTHTFDGDLVLSLITPTGAVITLADRQGAGGFSYVDTVFDDEAPSPIAAGSAPFTGTFRPETPLSAADGIASAGLWRLKVVDTAFADVGTIDGWSLTLSYPPIPCGPSLRYVSSEESDSCIAAGGGAGDSVLDPGEDVSLPVTLRNNGTTTVTAITATLSTTTPGVTVTRSEASFPDLAAGAHATSDAPHFAFTASSELTCGGLADFTVTAYANEGSWVQTFQVPIGLTVSGTLTHDAEDVPADLPDPGTATSTMVLSDPGVVTDVDVGVVVGHARDADLDIVLIAPDGTRVELSTDNGGDGANYVDTLFDDEAGASIVTGTAPFSGSFAPEEPLAVLDGTPAAGTWSLEITDDESQESGQLVAWSLRLSTVAGPTCHACALTAPERPLVQVRWGGTGKSRLEWEPLMEASYYTVYRGDRQHLPNLLDEGQDSCRRMTTNGTNTGNRLEEVPTAGSFLWYLVRAANGAGEGPLYPATAGPRVLDLFGDCP